MYLFFIEARVPLLLLTRRLHAQTNESHCDGSGLDRVPFGRPLRPRERTVFSVRSIGLFLRSHALLGSGRCADFPRDWRCLRTLRRHWLPGGVRRERVLPPRARGLFSGNLPGRLRKYLFGGWRSARVLLSAPRNPSPLAFREKRAYTSRVFPWLYRRFDRLFGAGELARGHTRGEEGGCLDASFAKPGRFERSGRGDAESVGPRAILRGVALFLSPL